MLDLRIYIWVYYIGTAGIYRNELSSASSNLWEGARVGPSRMPAKSTDEVIYYYIIQGRRIPQRRNNNLFTADGITIHIHDKY